MSPTNCSSIITRSHCPLCLENDNARVQFSNRPVDKSVVKTSCKPEPHTYHLGCITQHFENPVNDKKCKVCGQESLPLRRADGARFDEDSPYCESSALDICRRGDAASLERLLADFPQAATKKFRSAQTGELVSLLSIAASFGHIPCLKILINKGADDLDNAMDAAAHTSEFECMKFLLLDHIRGLDGAAKEIMSFVKSEGPVCEEETDDAYGDMMRALRQGDSDGLQAAIKPGGRDLNRYALFCAYFGHAECLKVLINNGAKAGISVHAAAYGGHVDVIRVVLDNFKARVGMHFAIPIAALSGRSGSLKFLLERMENIKPSYLKLALNYSRSYGYTECVELLKEAISIKILQFLESLESAQNTTQ